MQMNEMEECERPLLMRLMLGLNSRPITDRPRQSQLLAADCVQCGLCAANVWPPQTVCDECAPADCVRQTVCSKL